MPTALEGPRNLAHILSEANGNLSREVVTIASGAGKLNPGAVLGKITASDKYIHSPHAVVVGSEGAESAECVLAYAVDATLNDVEAVVTARSAEVKEPQLNFHASVDDAAKAAAKHSQLAAFDIITR